MFSVFNWTFDPDGDHNKINNIDPSLYLKIEKTTKNKKITIWDFSLPNDL